LKNPTPNIQLIYEQPCKERKKSQTADSYDLRIDYAGNIKSEPQISQINRWTLMIPGIDKPAEFQFGISEIDK